jgi:phage terminase small subunit
MTAKKPKLTVKQAKFVKAKAEGKTGVEAAMIAYDTEDYNTANAIAVENLQKPTIQEALNVAFEKQGITLDKLVEPIAKGLEATKTGSANGAVFPSSEPDHSIRLSAAKTALDLLGVSKSQGNTTINNFGTIVGEMKDNYAD